LRIGVSCLSEHLEVQLVVVAGLVGRLDRRDRRQLAPVVSLGVPTSAKYPLAFPTRNAVSDS
jgi:hypothetical protein